MTVDEKSKGNAKDEDNSTWVPEGFVKGGESRSCQRFERKMDMNEKDLRRRCNGHERIS